MTRLHIELNNASSELRLKVNEMWRGREIKNYKIFTNKNTGNPIISLETDSDEIIDFLQNSGQRILTNEEYEALTSVSKGDKGSDVQSLQRDLYKKGYYPNHPDVLPYDSHGARTFIFDDETELAVKDFQRANGLPVTGIANEETREKLTEI